jgi:hypothetical protein
MNWKKQKTKIRKHGIVVFLLALALLPNNAHAFQGVIDAVAAVPGQMTGAVTNAGLTILSLVVTTTTEFVLKIFDFLIQGFIILAKYNSFVDNPVVDIGWVAVRDFANLFFILILVAIALGTMLGVPKLNYKQNLMRLLMMAVLINFSKTITGIFIDFSQVIMLTFAYAMEAQAGFFLAGGAGRLRMGQILETGLNNPTGISTSLSMLRIIMSSLFDLIMMSLMSVIVGALFVMILARMVMLWILTILSPLAFLLSTFEQGKSYASKWWQYLSQNLIMGPALLFFVWLTFSIQSQMSVLVEKSFGEVSIENIGIGEIGTWESMMSFVITAAMLMGGIKLATDIGGAGADAVKGAQKFAGKMMRKGPGSVGAYMARRAYGGRAIPFAGKDNAVNKFLKGVELNPKNIVKNVKHAFSQQAVRDTEAGESEAMKRYFSGTGISPIVGGLSAKKATDYLYQRFQDKGMKEGATGLYGRGTKIGEREKSRDAAVAELAEQEESLKTKTAFERGVDLEVKNVDADIKAAATQTVDDERDAAIKKRLTDPGIDPTSKQGKSIMKEIGTERKGRLSEEYAKEKTKKREAIINDAATDFAVANNLQDAGEKEIQKTIDANQDNLDSMQGNHLTADQYAAQKKKVEEFQKEVSEIHKDIERKTLIDLGADVSVEADRLEALMKSIEDNGGKIDPSDMTMIDGRNVVVTSSMKPQTNITIDNLNVPDDEKKSLRDAQEETKKTLTAENVRLEAAKQYRGVSGRQQMKDAIREKRKEVVEKGTAVSAIRDPNQALFNAQERRNWILKKDKEIDTKNGPELTDMYKQMLSLGRGKDAAVAARRAAKSGHLRGFLEETVGEASYDGMKKLFDELTKKTKDGGAGLGDQDALAVIDDMSEFAEQKMEFGLARTVGSKHGKLQFNSREEHAEQWLAMLSRGGGNLWRQAPLTAYGSTRMRDPGNPFSPKMYEPGIGELHIAETMRKAIEKQLGRGVGVPEVMTAMKDSPVLKKMAESNAEIKTFLALMKRQSAGLSLVTDPRQHARKMMSRVAEAKKTP